MELDEQNVKRIKKSISTLGFIFLAFTCLIYFVSTTIEEYRQLPSLTTSKLDLAVRGDILSKDNFKIATSRKIYTASIDTRALDLDKKELFIKLFSIYSDMDERLVREKIDTSLKKPAYLIISREISSRAAKNLQLLGRKLIKLNVFHEIKINNTHLVFGLNIFETGETRDYPYDDTLTPVIGHLKKEMDSGEKARISGIKGLEKSYNTELNNIRNGILKGERDISSNIIFNRDSKIVTRKDGDVLNLNIPLRLQKNIEIMLDMYKEKLGADEIIISVMESKTGNVLSLASSNRFNPKFIRKEEIGNLNISAIEYQYEPGSVIKPIAISMVLEKNRATLTELINAHNNGPLDKNGEYPKGKIQIGNWNISDDHQFKKNMLTIEDIIINSSNIGTLILANRLSGKELLDGYHLFGINEKSGIDLPYEKVGTLPTINQVSAGEQSGNLNIFKSTISYGQGMTTTFMQLVKAYNVFNNDGGLISPSIVHKEIAQPTVNIISKKTVDTMKQLLIKTVQEGTGRNTIYEGLEIGGKTGTANTAGKGGYQKKYMSSFFGFVNDKEHKYTVGVTVNNPNSTGVHWYYYYAANSAVPVFKKIIDIMVKLNYLKPEVVAKPTEVPLAQP
ncbi:MAG: penicillin-binding protein 2 [Arcobacter sp.]|nr:penicillin-binding protein 2 [Arcobacter sp.]